MFNPHLPPAPPDLGPNHTRILRSECGPRFYQACLEFSQSLWLQRKPAQAILQLNKACFVPEKTAPYLALCWFLSNRDEELFVGNPVRHFQHLATRMSGIHCEIRAARAWTCFHLAEMILPSKSFPRDAQQIEIEQLKIPSLEEVRKKLPSSDSCHLPQALTFAKEHPRRAHSSTG